MVVQGEFVVEFLTIIHSIHEHLLVNLDILIVKILVKVLKNSDLILI